MTCSVTCSGEGTRRRCLFQHEGADGKGRVMVMLEFDDVGLAREVRLRHTGINTEWDLTGDGRVDVSELQSAEARQDISAEAYARICNWLGVPIETFFREAGTGKGD